MAKRQLPTKLNNERLAELAAAKLRALVTEHLEIETAEAHRLGGGASVVAGGEGWIYFPTQSPGVLGTAVIWANANSCNAINLIVDDGAGELAFAASAFAAPRPTIWEVSGRDMAVVEAQSPSIEPPPDCAELTAIMVSVGLDVVADHGVWLGEINGLEVARVGSREGGCAIDIGVGAYDQFASAALTPEDRDAAEALENVISMVRPHRSADSAPHALGRLVRSRWLRSQVVADPSIIGLDSLNPIPLLFARPGLMETQPAAGLGATVDGAVALVTFTVGLDLGIAETTAGLAALHEPDEIIVVVPPRDRHQRIVDAVDALSLPSRVIAIEGAWASN